MWIIDEVDEQYAPVELNWNDVDQQMLDVVLNARHNYPNCWTRHLMHCNADAYDWLLHRHPLLGEARFTNVTRLYWLLHKLSFWEKCPICGKTKHMHKNVDNFEQGYFRACCKECAAANPERQKKIADTTEKHYGSRNFFTSDAGKKKIKKYLDENGIANAFQLESVKRKSRESRKAHFGYEYTMQSPEKRKLASENYKEKRGYAHPFSDPNVVAKCKKTQRENIDAGIDPKAKFKENWRTKRYNSIVALSDEVKPLFSREYFMQFNSNEQYHVLLDWHCNKCGNDFSAYLDQNLITREHLPARCLACHPISNGTSRFEYEIERFLREDCHVADVSLHDRTILKPYEVDIMLPSRKFCIEFDGLFFHSEANGGKSKNYHVFKTNEARKCGYQLIHVFEDEWVNKRPIVESRLKSLLGIPEKRIWARRCIIRNVDAKTTKLFMNTNHLQGWSHSSVNLGLFCDETLVAMMTFGKPRYNKKHEWELIRYCSLLGHQVVGGAGKLLKHFEKTFKPKSLLSYADYRWSNGKMYDALGFKLDYLSEPNYWYVRSNMCKRFSRIAFQKHKLRSVLEHFDDSLSEVENMRNNGFDRIFDCGNLVYVKMY